MTQNSAHDIVQKYHRAWTSGDIDTAMNSVADDIVCRAPGVDLDGKDAYRGFIGGFAPMLTNSARSPSSSTGTGWHCSTTRRPPRPRPPLRPRSSPSRMGRSLRAC